MINNCNLRTAQERKNDEFYTPQDFIKNELDCYKEHFKGKVVYLPCDNPRFSNFVKYFTDNKSALGLKGLLVSYIGEEFKEKIEGVDAVCNCSFESETARELAARSDIIVTNPPFSFFGAFLDFCLTSKKKFLIIAPLLLLSRKEVFESYKKRLFCYGENKHFPKGVCYFETNQKNKKRVPCAWVTNVKESKRNFKPKESLEKLNRLDYPKYKEDKILYLKSINDYPKNYYNIVAIPLTAVYKLDRKQFEIIRRYDGKLKNNQKAYSRILVKRIKENDN